MRTAGILLPVSAMPSPYGIGVFGKETIHFLDKAADMHFHRWQVLPFTMTDAHNSPYASASAFAGNYLFIDPRGLAEEGLVSEAEAADGEYPGSPYTADYEFAGERRLALLRLAFSRLSGEKAQKVKSFAGEQEWLPPFALFMAIREEQNGAPWWEWPKELARYETAKTYARKYEEQTAFWKFVQYEFFRQWDRIKAYAEEKGIEVIGDMPIYVSRDSSDVWSHRELFLLDAETYEPEKVAGVPPDYFSADGQLWGNPLYDWVAMEKDNYRWWCERIRAALQLYDTVRIDHFRAFASYWAVPADSDTAKNGVWEKGPGKALFDAVENELGEVPIVAEDLGVFGEDVVKLLEDTKFPGMRVIQFGFEPDADSTHLPHNYPRNCLAYVGTHDNNTLLAWLWEADDYHRRYALDYCGFTGDNWGEGGFHSPSCRKIIETVWRSHAAVAIISYQDLCGFGSDARMNVPGRAFGNWQFRTTEDMIAQIDAEYYKKINRIFKR